MRKARYICLEGTEGVGKTTQTQKLVDYLKNKGYSVLQTKEPGTPLCPLTMQLRAIMLDKQYDEVLTAPARELISQAIRSIHLEKVVYPAMNEYDFIIQDRGIASGLAYGSACGNSLDLLHTLTNFIVDPKMYPLYDKIVHLKGDPSKGLKLAKASKQEFAAGDAMESRGESFINKASDNMDSACRHLGAVVVEVDGKSVDQVFEDILSVLNIGEKV